MIRTLVFIIAVAIIAATAGVSRAATLDGGIGATSLATTDVSLTVPDFLRISNLSAFNFGVYPGTGAFNGDTDVCLYYSGSGDYRVTVTDDSQNVTPNSLGVENASDAFDIDMRVFWNDVTGTTGRRRTRFGTPRVRQDGQNQTSSDCSVGGMSANLSIRLRGADLRAAPGGDYDSELTILVEPD